jgi:predicted ATPase/DNA-binding SARP family transcriptional activator
MPDIRFRVLGPLEADARGSTIDLGSPRQRTVLAILVALSNETVSAERLIEEIWGEAAPPRARHSLQTYVSNLRRLLGRDRIRTVHPGYVLDVAGGELDREEFERLVARGRRVVGEDPRAAAADLVAAVELWRGSEPYSGLADDVPVLGQEAQRLRETRLVAIEQLAEARLALGEHDRIVAELQDLAPRHPYREGLWSLLMRALYRSGRQAEALAAYRALRSRLVEELGIDPSPELQDLELRLLTQSEPQAVAAHPRHTLPSTLSSFIGRDADLRRVVRSVSDERLVTITGPAGVGKTRLAVEASHRLLGDFAGGAYFVDLTSVSSGRDVPGAVASGLLLNDQSGRSPERAVGDYLMGRHLLLVLDNCEHVAASVAALVWQWVTGNERLHVLASSQERLDLDGEIVIGLAPLAVGEGEVESEAETLFLARMRQHTGSSAVTAEDRRAVGEICRLLEGLPLAIELAASRTRMMSPSDIVTRLDDRFALLSAGHREAPVRHQTLRSAVDWSYSLLGGAERRVFDRLAVLSGDFTLESAEAVAGAGSEGAFLDTLEALVNRSLVTLVTGGRPARYRMLETLRLFGRERLRSEDQLDALERRRAEVFASIAVREAKRVRSTGFADAVARIDADLPNIRGSFRWAVAHGEYGLAFDLTRPLWSLVYAGARRHLHEGDDWRDTLIAASPDPGMRARLLAEQAFSRWLGGDQASADRCARESLALGELGGLEESLAVEVLALSAATNRETDDAVELARRVLEIGGDDVDAHGYEALAMAYIFGGRAEEAVDAVERIFALAEQRGDPLRRIRALALMGAAVQPLDLEASLRVLDEAVETTSALGMDWDLAGAVMARSLTRLNGGDVAGGLADLAWAGRLTYRVRDLRRLAQTLEILGGVLAGRGRGIEAARVLSASAVLRRKAGVIGSEAQEESRGAAMTQLEEGLDPESFAAAHAWGRETAMADVAEYAVRVAKAELAGLTPA